MRLLVDPVVLYLPTHMGALASKPSAYLDYLMSWGELIHKQGNEFYIPKRCEQALYNEDCFLNPIRLQGYLKKLPGTAIHGVCTTILGRFYAWPRFGETINLPPYNQINLTPDLCSRIPNPAIAESLRQTLGYIAWARTITNIPDLYLLTHPTSHTRIRIDVQTPSGHTVSDSLLIKVAP